MKMNILAFVDSHGEKAALDSVLHKSEKADLIICAGDLTSWGSGLVEALNYLKKAKKPMLIIPGNHEIDKELKKACEKFDYVIYLDKGSFEIENYVFFGYGGGGFSKIDDVFESLAKNFIKHLKKDQKIILITHAPPYGTKIDDMGSVGHRGCLSITNFIEKQKPILSISGHLHETAGRKQMLGKTLVINPGGHGKLIRI